MNERMKRLQAVLQQNDIDGALYATSSNMQYLLDDVTYHWQRTMYTGCLPFMQKEGVSGHFLNDPDCILYIPAQGEPTLFMTFDRSKDMMHLDIHKEIGYFHRLMDMVSPYLKGKTIALGESCRHYFEDLLEEFAPQMKAVDGEDFVLKMRMVKDAKEIEAMRRVAAFTDQAMEKVTAALRPGITKGQVEQMLADIGVEAGLRDVSFPPAALFMETGTKQAENLGSDTPDMVLTPGMSIAFDFGYVMDGYCSDYGRSFYCGKAPDGIADGYKALQEAQCYLLSLIRPGIPMDLCFATLQKKMDACGGFGKYLRKADFPGLMGHQIGIDVHEHPWVHDEQKQEFLPGMIMCIEPKLWWPGQCYLRVEDMVLITETGCESLTVFDRERFSLPA